MSKIAPYLLHPVLKVAGAAGGVVGAGVYSFPQKINTPTVHNSCKIKACIFIASVSILYVSALIFLVAAARQQQSRESKQATADNNKVGIICLYTILLKEHHTQKVPRLLLCLTEIKLYCPEIINLIREQRKWRQF